MEEGELTSRVIGAAIEVHRHVGPGLLESMYEEYLVFELRSRGHVLERQKPLDLRYKTLDLSGHYRVDLIVDSKIVIEVKSVAAILPVHEAQLLTYLRLTGCPVRAVVQLQISHPRRRHASPSEHISAPPRLGGEKGAVQ